MLRRKLEESSSAINMIKIDYNKKKEQQEEEDKIQEALTARRKSVQLSEVQNVTKDTNSKAEKEEKNSEKKGKVEGAPNGAFILETSSKSPKPDNTMAYLIVIGLLGLALGKLL